MVHIQSMYDDLSDEDLLAIVYDEMVGGVALIDLLDDAIDSIPSEERSDFRVAFAIVRCALDAAGNHRRVTHAPDSLSYFEETT